MTCFICQSGDIKPYLNKSNYQYFKCHQCGFVFLQPTPINTHKFYTDKYFNLADSELASGYVNYEQDKAVMDTFYNQCLKQIKKILSRPDLKLLDIGTATGYFLDLAQAQGIQAEGIEINQHMIHAGQRQGRQVSYGQLGKLDQDYVTRRHHSFDIITLWDTIEHLPDLTSSFDEINKLLKPQGILVVGTPDIGSFWARFFGPRWHSFVPPEHILFFNQKNIQTFLTAQGLNTLKTATIHKTFTLPYIFNMAYRWLKIKLLSSISHLLTKSKFVSHLKFKIPIGDNMLVYARKTK
jgi:2-polyprenyl-3-methyl-5-hydroxy-6-metoxy-1,4-benzoquinol methylase